MRSRRLVAAFGGLIAQALLIELLALIRPVGFEAFYSMQQAEAAERLAELITLPFDFRAAIVTAALAVALLISPRRIRWVVLCWELLLAVPSAAVLVVSIGYGDLAYDAQFGAYVAAAVAAAGLALTCTRPRSNNR